MSHAVIPAAQAGKVSKKTGFRDGLGITLCPTHVHVFVYHPTMVLRWREDIMVCAHAMVACLLAACILFAGLVGGVGYAMARREVGLQTPAKTLVCLSGVLTGVCVGAVATSWLEAVELAMFAAALLACSVTDLARRVIPNRVVVGILVIRGTYLCVEAAWDSASGQGGSYVLEKAGASVAGGALVLLALVAIQLLWARVRGSPQQGLGGGDAKLLSACGFYLGAVGGMACVALSCVLALACCLGAWVFGCARGERRPLPRAFPLAPQVLASVVILTAYRAF